HKYGETTITPNVLMHWVHYDPDSYTETGAGGLSQRVDGDTMNIFELGIGVKAGWQHTNADGSKLTPQVRVGYRYDLIGDNVEATSSFTGGGAAFDTKGPDPAQSSFNLGGTLKYDANDSWEFTASYDLDAKEDYISNAGFVRAGYKF